MDCSFCGRPVDLPIGDECSDCQRRMNHNAKIDPQHPDSICAGCLEPLYYGLDGYLYEYYSPAKSLRAHNCPANE